MYLRTKRMVYSSTVRSVAAIVAGEAGGARVAVCRSTLVVTKPRRVATTASDESSRAGLILTRSAPAEMSPLLVPGGRIVCTHAMRFTRGAPSLALPLALWCAVCALALAPLTVDAARPMSGRQLSQSDDEAMMAYATNAWGLPVNTWKAANSKSSSHVLPRMQEHHTSLHRTTHGWIEGYVPKEYAPLTVSLIVYFSLLFSLLLPYGQLV
jgi:hypothetical protein